MDGPNCFWQHTELRMLLQSTLGRLLSDLLSCSAQRCRDNQGSIGGCRSLKSLTWSSSPVFPVPRGSVIVLLPFLFEIDVRLVAFVAMPAATVTFKVP